ncbi:MAG TPA: sulfatase-like hydrolase/transferase [Chloroflexota bacterium]|nr:sulfatase-like hydrolase/transferase [Chloroflexota bacterium]
MELPTPPARPNLLFVFADEMRGSAMGCAGNTDVRTPALDGLARGGVRFTNAVANNAVCTPARGSILTGCWPQTHRALANDLPVDPGAPSIARALRAKGYRCGYIGKWHVGGMPRDRFIPPGAERLGFDDFWAAWNCAHRYLRPAYHLNDSPQPVVHEGRYEPEMQADLALEWVGSLGLDEPWCLFLSFGPPHEPYRPLPPGYEGTYDPNALTLRPNCPDTPEYRQDLADYYTHVTALDDQVARLLASLEGRGQLDSTLVVFTSDHGSMIGSHGRENKHSPWEEATVIPLLMRLPGTVPQGREDDALIGHPDLAPTLLSLMGVAPDRRMEGRDVSRRIRSAEGEGPDSVYLQAVICADQAAKDGLIEWRGVRTRGATYAANLRGPWLLYDNEADPYQLRNLVDEPSAAALRERMAGELKRWMAETNDRLEAKEVVLERYGLKRVWDERAATNRRLRAAGLPRG